MNKAMFIYGDHRSPIDAATYQIHPTEQLLFPFMNFTCHSMITGLSFVARINDDSNRDQNSATSWPVFSVWHHDGNNVSTQHLGPTHPNQMNSIQLPSRPDGQMEMMFTINFAPPIQVDNGSFLGLRQYYFNTSSHDHQPNLYVLRQSGGYVLTLVCDDHYGSNDCLMDGTGCQEVPYVTVDTSM